MIKNNCCFIKEQYFIENSHFEKMLDSGYTTKQSKRTHICVAFEIDDNKYYIPLRRNLGNPNRRFGKIGFAVPCASRPDAGLDYRYALIVNDDSYIEIPKYPKIPNSQIVIINNEYEMIKKEFKNYLDGFKRTAKKGRIEKKALYRESSLINFLHELNI